MDGRRFRRQRDRSLEMRSGAGPLPVEVHDGRGVHRVPFPEVGTKRQRARGGGLGCRVGILRRDGAFTATLSVHVTPRNCDFTRNWTATKLGAPNVIP